MEIDVVTKWMNGTSQLHNVLLKPLGDMLKEISSRFDFITFTHIFREHNTMVDILLKEGQQSIESQMTLIEINDSVSSVTHQTV
jgi:hypothetical protein